MTAPAPDKSLVGIGDELSLLGRKVRFRALTVGQRFKVAQMRDQARVWLNRRFKGYEDSSDTERIFEAAQNFRLFSLAAPYIIGAWAGEGEPPTADDLLDAYDHELEACLQEIRRLNPTAVDLPAPNQ